MDNFTPAKAECKSLSSNHNKKFTFYFNLQFTLQAQQFKTWTFLHLPRQSISPYPVNEGQPLFQQTLVMGNREKLIKLS